MHNTVFAFVSVPLKTWGRKKGVLSAKLRLLEPESAIRFAPQQAHHLCAVCARGQPTAAAVCAESEATLTGLR